MSTETRRVGGNYSFADTVYNPTPNPMWDDYPALAIAQDPSIAYVDGDDFFDFDGSAGFTITGEAGYTIEASDASGGKVVLTTDGDDNDGLEIQRGATAGAAGESVILAAGKPVWFETKLAVADIDACDFACGLMTTDTDIVTDAGDFVVTGGVYFANAHDGDLDYYTESATTETTGDTGVNLLDATEVKLGIKWDGISAVTFWVDGVKVATSTTNIPTTELRLSYGIKNTGGAAEAVTVDYYKVAAIR